VGQQPPRERESRPAASWERSQRRPAAQAIVIQAARSAAGTGDGGGTRAEPSGHSGHTGRSSHPRHSSHSGHTGTATEAFIDRRPQRRAAGGAATPARTRIASSRFVGALPSAPPRKSSSSRRGCAAGGTSRSATTPATRSAPHRGGFMIVLRTG
jgi:hypothetical protein